MGMWVASNGIPCPAERATKRGAERRMKLQSGRQPTPKRGPRRLPPEEWAENTKKTAAKTNSCDKHAHTHTRARTHTHTHTQHAQSTKQRSSEKKGRKERQRKNESKERSKGRKEGREGGREGGREEGRKEGRKKERKGGRQEGRRKKKHERQNASPALARAPSSLSVSKFQRTPSPLPLSSHSLPFTPTDSVRKVKCASS